MTHLVLGLNNYLAGPISYLLNNIYETTNQIILSLQEARNSKAQYEVARMIQREYPNESFDYIYHLIKQGNLNELDK